MGKRKRLQEFLKRTKFVSWGREFVKEQEVARLQQRAHGVQCVSSRPVKVGIQMQDQPFSPTESVKEYGQSIVKQADLKGTARVFDRGQFAIGTESADWIGKPALG